jgi:dihydrofolate synthase / folylpolyglutamate synthase
MKGRNNSHRTKKEFQEALEYLYGLEKFGMIFGLKQIESILEAIGNPHQSIPCIHIGGTNGKGSTAALLDSILRQDGYRVGLYTSPHLIRFTERILVDGEEIAEEAVSDLTRRIREATEAARVRPPFTFFDFTTALALLYFSERNVDLAILEVGLGGRLDSTNVVDPLLSIVTNVERDHEAVLGKGIMKIAGEKAGIIKKGRPFITAATQAPVIRLFAGVCRRQGASLFRVGRQFRYIPVKPRIFHYEGLHRKLWDVTLRLSGPHQVVNATTALGAAEVLDELGYSVSTEGMMEGLRSAAWPGRLEMVRSSPPVLLDGAHNPAGALALRDALRSEFEFRRLILVIGILEDKDVQGILDILSPLADHMILTRPGIERAAPAALLMKALGKGAAKAEISDRFEDAIEKGLSMTGQDDLLCITGSLYMVGEAKSLFIRQGR